MVDFDDDFDEYAIQGKPIKAYKNGIFENPKALFVQHYWSWDEFIFSASQRLEMVPMASRVFNADGTEIDDIMCIEENDMLFFSTGMPFKAPSTNKDDADVSQEDGFENVVGGYKVGPLLGRGGFGEVRLGTHQVTNDKVALKFILKNEMGSLGDVERTTTEIQCLTALNHPSIIKLVRVINEPNHVVLVIELLEGGDLYHFLRNIAGGCLSEPEGAALFTQILAGVGYAHNQHICHRDLKLENILLLNKNDVSMVKIADFGLSDFYKPGAMMKTSCGSLSYLAPEVFRGTSNAGPPLDVWSLGVILFAIVCGRLPFEGNDLHGTNRPRENVIRNRIMRGRYKLDEHLSPSFTELITRMLKPDPNERATIPEIFVHPWIRSSGVVVFPVDTTSFQQEANQETIAADTPASPLAPSSVKPLSPGVTAASEEKLPSLVAKLSYKQGNGTGTAALVSPITNSLFKSLGGRHRLTRLESTKAKMEKSPRVSSMPHGVQLKIAQGSSPTQLNSKRITALTRKQRQRTSTSLIANGCTSPEGERLPTAQNKAARRRPD